MYVHILNMDIMCAYIYFICFDIFSDIYLNYDIILHYIIEGITVGMVGMATEVFSLMDDVKQCEIYQLRVYLCRSMTIKTDRYIDDRHMRLTFDPRNVCTIMLQIVR